MTSDIIPLIHQIRYLQNKLKDSKLPAGAYIETLDSLQYRPPDNLLPLDGTVIPRPWVPDLDAITPLQGSMISCTLLTPPGDTEGYPYRMLHWMGDFFAGEDCSIIVWEDTALVRKQVTPTGGNEGIVVGYHDLGAGAQKFAIIHRNRWAEGDPPDNWTCGHLEYWMTDAGGTTWSQVPTSTLIPYLHRPAATYAEVKERKFGVTKSGGDFWIVITPADDQTTLHPTRLLKWNLSAPTVALETIGVLHPKLTDWFVSPQGIYLSGQGYMGHLGYPPEGVKIRGYTSLGAETIAPVQELLCNSLNGPLGLYDGNRYGCPPPLWNAQSTAEEGLYQSFFMRTPERFTEGEYCTFHGSSYNKQSELAVDSTVWLMGGEDEDGFPSLQGCVGFRHWHKITDPSFASLTGEWFTGGFNVTDTGNASSQCVLMLLRSSTVPRIAKLLFNPGALQITIPTVPPAGGIMKWMVAGTNLTFISTRPGGGMGGA